MKRLTFSPLVLASVLILSLAIFPFSVSAQNGWNVALWGRLFETWDYAYDVEISGDYAFIASGETGLRILDVHDPTRIIEVGCFDSPGDARGVFVDGGYAYLADGLNGLCVLSIDTPETPDLVGQLNIPGVNVTDVAVYGQYVYISCAADSLRGVDVSDPTSPELVWTSAAIGSGREIELSGNIMLFNSTGGLILYDLIDPGNPEKKSSVDSTEVEGAAVRDGYLFAHYDSELHVFDVSDISSPQQVGTLQTNVDALSMAVGDTLLFLTASDHDGEFLIVSVSYPSAPAILGRYTTPGTPQDVEAVGYNAFIADGEGGLRIVDFYDPVNFEEIGSYRMTEVKSVASWQNQAYMVMLDNLLQVSISDGSPEITGIASFPDTLYDVAVNAEHICAVNGRRYVDKEQVVFECGLHVLDPQTMDKLGLYAETERTFWPAPRVEVSGDHAFLAPNFWPPDLEVRVLDMSTPDSPIIAGGFTPNEDDILADMDCENNYLYSVYPDSAVLIHDVSDPTNVFQVGEIYLEETTELIAVEGDLAFVGYGGGKVAILDVSNPSSPAQIGEFWAGGSLSAIDAHGQYLFLISNTYGLQIIDVSTPQSPEEAGYFMESLDAKMIAIAGEQVFVVGPNGVTVLQLTGDLSTVDDGEIALPATYSISAVYPNPFNPSLNVEVNLPRSSDLHVAVYNLVGRKVAELANGFYRPGRHRLLFDGSHRASGVYFIRAEVPGRWSATKKVTLLR